MNKKKFRILLYTIFIIISFIYYDLIIKTRGLFIYIVMTTAMIAALIYEFWNKK